MKIRKPTGGWRTIESPLEGIKTAQRLILSCLMSKVEGNGLSVHQALHQFMNNIDGGFHWVASVDIKDCFTSINPKKALALIDTRITDGVPGQYGRRSLPQGHPISPFLANLYLNQFDRMVASWHTPYYMSDGSTMECRVIRYVDNIWLMCRKRKELEAYLSLSLNYISDLGLTPRVESIRHVNQSIDLLGYMVQKRSIRPNSRNIQRFKERCMEYVLRRKELEERLSMENRMESVEETKAEIEYIERGFTNFLIGWQKHFRTDMMSWVQKLLRGLTNATTAGSTRKGYIRSTIRQYSRRQKNDQDKGGWPPAMKVGLTELEGLTMELSPVQAHQFEI
jgi:hypothetical protein